MSELAVSNPIVQHSKLSFSSRSRWRNCGISVAWSSGMSDKSSPAAAEGTLAHAAGEHYLRQAFGLPGAQPGDAPIQQPPEGLDLKGKTVEQWNDDMRQHGLAYVEFVKSLIPAGAGGHVVIEEKVAARGISPDLWGTADCLLWIPQIKQLYVIDYKYGFMEVDIGTVDDTNPQLSAYAVASVEQWFLQFDSIGLAVYQPRRTFGQVAQTIVLDAAWHAAEREKLMREVERVRTATEPVPGDWCRYCKAKPKCPAIHNALSAGIQAHSGVFDVLSIPSDDLLDLWAARAGFKALIADIEERVEQMVKDGNPRLTVKTGKGRQMWADAPGAAMALLAMGRTDLLAPVAVSQAAPALPEEWKKALITHSAPSRSIQLVSEVSPSQIAATFAKYAKPVDKA